jgi:hypothetical protein
MPKVTHAASIFRTNASIRKWAAEVASWGRFLAPMLPEQAAANPGGLPVPCLVISNKADLRGVPKSPWSLLFSLPQAAANPGGLPVPASSSATGLICMARFETAKM